MEHPPNISAEIVVVGAGLAGTVAPAVLAQQDWRLILTLLGSHGAWNAAQGRIELGQVDFGKKPRAVEATRAMKSPAREVQLKTVQLDCAGINTQRRCNPLLGIFAAIRTDPAWIA